MEVFVELTIPTFFARVPLIRTALLRFSDFLEKRERAKQESIAEKERPYRERVERAKEFIACLTESHKLQKLFEKEERIKESHFAQSSGSSSGFFLILGGASSYSKTEHDEKEINQIFVTFAWEHEGSYIISRVPLNEVRVRFDEKATPSVEIHLISMLAFFHTRALLYPSYHNDIYFGKYSPAEHLRDNQIGFFREKVAYVTIVCKESDWPKSIRMPLNRKSEEKKPVAKTA